MENFAEKFISSGLKRLDDQLRFTAEIDEMTGILRRTVLLDKSRRENDAEHSWHIAVMALLFAEYAVEKPDIHHAVEMLLVHDLVEIYAGDTFAYDVVGNLDKAQREQQAADRLYSMLPAEQGTHLRQLWEEFDAAETTEARYANCLDRLQPFLHNMLTEGHTWRNSNPRPRREQVEKRMSIMQDFMPQVYQWTEKCMSHAVSCGWLME